MARGATDSDRGEEESRAEGIDDQVAERAEEEVAGDDDDDVSDSGDDVVLLGFVQKPSHDWSLERHRFPSKVGGAPVMSRRQQHLSHLARPVGSSPRSWSFRAFPASRLQPIQRERMPCHVEACDTTWSHVMACDGQMERHAMVYGEACMDPDNISCRPSHAVHLMPSISCRPSHAVHLMPSISCRPSHAVHLMPSISCRPSHAAYLDPLNVPSDALLCHFCSQPLRFLLQVYAPVDSEPSAFHRTLFLFACRHPHCLTRHHQEQQQAEVADGRARERRRSCRAPTPSTPSPRPPRMHLGHHSPTKVTPSPSSPASNPAATLTFSHDPGHLPSPSSALPIICPPHHLPSPSSPLPIISPPHHLPSWLKSLPPSLHPQCPCARGVARGGAASAVGGAGRWPTAARTTRFVLEQGPPAARIPSASADAESAGGAGNDVSAADWRVTVLDRGGWKEWEMVVEEEPEEGEEGEEGENREEAGREGGSEGEKGPGAGAGGAEVRRLMREYRERTRAEGPIAASELEGFGDVSCQERTGGLSREDRRSCDVGGVGDGVAVCMGWAWSGHGVGMEWAWGGLAHGVGAGADAEKKQWAAFQAVIAKAPEQVIRYCRSATARPLWPQLQGQPPSQAAIPPCGGCGAPRIFEFQVLPQIIYYSAPDATADSALDFATLAVYVCPNSCCRSSPLSTAQQSSVAVPRSVDSGVEATAVGASAEGSSSAAGSRDAGSGDVKGCEVAGQRGGLQEQSMGYVEEFVWVQLPTQDPLVIAQTD
ncbi:unnamed protein product [Closterium sp. NIES-65]|nr:unnamed protein product [Closterium sp. NIES-65]